MLRKLALFLLLGLLPAVHLAAGEVLRVVVTDPYLDLHTGPGRGYPITRSVPRGAHVEVLFQRTDWIKVRSDKGKEGWAHRSQMRRTLTTAGGALEMSGPAADARDDGRLTHGS